MDKKIYPGIKFTFLISFLPHQHIDRCKLFAVSTPQNPFGNSRLLIFFLQLYIQGNYFILKWTVSIFTKTLLTLEWMAVILLLKTTTKNIHLNWFSSLSKSTNSYATFNSSYYFFAKGTYKITTTTDEKLGKEMSFNC